MQCKDFFSSQCLKYLFNSEAIKQNRIPEGNRTRCPKCGKVK